MSQVSVIIPSFNNARWLPQCLDSCIAQGTDYLKEVIVVDDGSADESWDILKEYQQKHPEIIKPFRNKEKGANQARNYGFLQSSGQFIQWLDSDDIIAEGKFKAQLAHLEKNSKAMAVYSDWRFDFYENGEFQRSQTTIARQYTDYLFELLRDNWQPCHNYLMRRKLAEETYRAKGWNPETKVAQDREFFLKAALINRNFHYVPGVFAVYNIWSQNSISHIAFKQRLELQMQADAVWRQLIRKARHLSEKEKKQYIALLNTHCLNAGFYHRGIMLNETFSFFSIYWPLLHWKKYPFIPLIYLYLTIKFRLKK